MSADEQDPDNVQLYTSSGDQYPFAPNVYFAFPAAFQIYKGEDWKARACNTADGTSTCNSHEPGWDCLEPFGVSLVERGCPRRTRLRIVSMGPAWSARPAAFIILCRLHLHAWRPVVWDKIWRIAPSG